MKMKMKRKEKKRRKKGEIKIKSIFSDLDNYIYSLLLEKSLKNRIEFSKGDSYPKYLEVYSN